MKKTDTVICDQHGEQQITYVCIHLAASRQTKEIVGYFCSTATNDNLRPDAWCIECEERLQSNNGTWSHEIEKYAGITILCGKCYDLAKKINDVF